MTPVITSFIVFVCITAGLLFGMFLRSRLPEQHLSGDAKDVVRLGTGLIGTIAALVLGLLIASASSTYSNQNTQVNQITARIILIDNILAEYGPETKPARELLRRAVDVLADRIWHENGTGTAKGTFFDISNSAQAAETALLNLSPANETQRAIKERAVQASIDLAQTRLLLFAQRGNSIPMPFLVVLVFWLTMIFASFSLFAEPNAVIIASLFVFAISATAAIFLILELDQPFTGLMEISSEPLRTALVPLAH